MGYILGIDIGNTTLEIGIIKDLNNIQSFKLSSDKNKTVDNWLIDFFTIFNYLDLEKKDIRDSYISSTVPILEDKIAEAIKKFFNKEPKVLGKNLSIPLKNNYKKPEEVGIDRLLNGFSAYKLFNLPLIVVDLGTAITFDIINKNGEYEGGAIFPGINASIEALFSKTAKLPKVNLANTKHIIGKTTIESIQSGLLFGYVSLIEGMINRINKEVGYNHNIVITGGNGELISKNLSIRHIYEPYLAMKGIYLLSQELEEFNRNIKHII
jgi:type III pantothenate kinase